jgi:hypothetical protein
VTPTEAIAFVRLHGVVLESATGPVPSLTAAIAGGPIRGSWWGHAQGREIFALTRAVRDSSDVLVCRLVQGKITYVDRRLWPALVRVSGKFPRQHLAKICERHTVTGRHATDEMPFPNWVSAELLTQSRNIDEPAALGALGAWCQN